MPSKTTTTPKTVIKTVTKEVAPEPKNILASKTFWLNTVAFLIPALDMTLQMNLIKDPEYYALGVAILNVLLRFKTDKGVRVR